MNVWMAWVIEFQFHKSFLVKLAGTLYPDDSWLLGQK